MAILFPCPKRPHPPFLEDPIPLAPHFLDTRTAGRLLTHGTTLEDTGATYDGDVVGDHEQLLDELVGRHVGRGQLRPLILQHVQQAPPVHHVRHVALQQLLTADRLHSKNGKVRRAFDEKGLDKVGVTLSAVMLSYPKRWRFSM